jgi:hypothetical protein
MTRADAEAQTIHEIYDQLAAEGQRLTGVMGELVEVTRTWADPRLASILSALGIDHLRLPTHCPGGPTLSTGHCT